jgi:hypothetical protein
LDRFAQENATILAGVILTLAAFPANAEIHDPVVACLFDEVIYHPRWQNQTIRLADIFVYQD